MVEQLSNGPWMLIDAAGPETVIGLVQGGKWLARNNREGDFLEWHEAAIGKVLEEAGLSLPELEGTLYASGPGSTLGLRHADPLSHGDASAGALAMLPVPES